MTDKVHMGHTFWPSLQDISLKRFRMRYSTRNDCYYLHWDDTICPPLAKINGLKDGIFSCTGVKRCVDKNTNEAYLCCDENADSAHLEWRIDFSQCGLVVYNVQIKAVSSPTAEEDQEGEEEEEEDEEMLGISYMVRGNDVLLTPELGDYHTELLDLRGCDKLSITADFQSHTANNRPVHLLPESDNNNMECPLDIIIDLMCPRPKKDVYCGEILLGIKFSSSDASSGTCVLGSSPGTCSEEENGVILNCCRLREGQLQVHVVEGARLVDEITNKPFKTVVKCTLLPDTGRYASKHTTPRNNAYPTWTENFIFNGITKEELVLGGLEVSLYDHHHFSGDHAIGGLRLCRPKRKEERSLTFSMSEDASPCRSRSASPAADTNGFSGSPRLEYSNSPSPTNTDVDLQNSLEQESFREKSRSLPQSDLSRAYKLPIARCRSPGAGTRSPALLSPTDHTSRGLHVAESNKKNSPGSSPKLSPLSAAKNKFRLSGSHFLAALSPHSSPRGSPRNSPHLSRKKIYGSAHNLDDQESEFIHWWMGAVVQGERDHWSQVLEKEGEWIYFWHSIRYKLKSVS